MRQRRLLSSSYLCLTGLIIVALIAGIVIGSTIIGRPLFDMLSFLNNIWFSLNKNAGAVQAIFTIIYVIVLIILVVLTRRYANAAEKAVVAQKDTIKTMVRPYLTVSFDEKLYRKTNKIIFIVKNIGNATAVGPWIEVRVVGREEEEILGAYPYEMAGNWSGSSLAQGAVMDIVPKLVSQPGDIIVFPDDIDTLELGEVHAKISLGCSDLFDEPVMHKSKSINLGAVYEGEGSPHLTESEAMKIMSESIEPMKKALNIIIENVRSCDFDLEPNLPIGSRYEIYLSKYVRSYYAPGLVVRYAQIRADYLKLGRGKGSAIDTMTEFNSLMREYVEANLPTSFDHPRNPSEKIPTSRIFEKSPGDKFFLDRMFLKGRIDKKEIDLFLGGSFLTRSRRGLLKQLKPEAPPVGIVEDLMRHCLSESNKLKAFRAKMVSTTSQCSNLIADLEQYRKILLYRTYE